MLILYYFSFLKKYMIIFKVNHFRVMDNSANNVCFINWQYISSFLNQFKIKFQVFIEIQTLDGKKILYIYIL